MKAAIIYFTKSGNTEKVASAIRDCLQSVGIDVHYSTVQQAEDLDYFTYDLICLGFPSYMWSPPELMKKFLKSNFKTHREENRVKPGAPKEPGKYVIIFCTYSGPHTGINEAIPAGKYAGQFFEHIGFTILDELYVVGEFHGSEELSTKGRLGDIRDRPNDKDLDHVRMRVNEILQRIVHEI